MLVLRKPELSLWDSILPDELRKLPEELATVSEYLDDDRFMAPFLARGQHRVGRPTVPIERYLRLMYLKHRRELGYETLVQEVNDSIMLRRFCRFDVCDRLPHPTTLSRLTKRFGDEAIQELNRLLVGKLHEDKLIRGDKIRTDTTVTGANVEHPTDAGLLADGVRVITRTVHALKGVKDNLAEGFRDQTRKMKNTLWEIGRFLKTRAVQAKEQLEGAAAKAGKAVSDGVQQMAQEAGQAVEEAQEALQSVGQGAKDKATLIRERVDALTAQAARTARQVLKQARELAARVGRRVARTSKKTKMRAAQLRDELLQWVELTERALDQTRQRLAGITSIPNRMVSQFAPTRARFGEASSARPWSSATRSSSLKSTGRSSQSDYQVHVGNPADVTMAVGVVDRHIEQFGHAPKEFAADRGYYSAANEKALTERGVKRVSIPARGKLSAKKAEHRGCRGSSAFSGSGRGARGPSAT